MYDTQYINMIIHIVLYKYIGVNGVETTSIKKQKSKSNS